ncbi:MAG: hypothetical protein AAB296_10145 [Candidatus Desantisbacteria bacterium]
MRLLMIIGLVIFIVASPSAGAADVSNKEVIDEITDVKVQIARLEAKMEEALKAMDKRIDDVRSDLKGDIEDLRGLVYVAIGGIMTLMCGLLTMIGFVLWDRRTAITPVVRKTKELETGFEDERVVLRKVLKGYAVVEPRFAEVLRTAGML